MEGNETLSSGIGRIFTGSTNGIILSMPNEGLFFSENSLYNSDLYPYNPFLISLERSRLLHSQQVLLGIHMRRIVMILSVKLEDSKIVRRKRNINRVVKILSRTTLTLATLFLFSGQVLASDFTNDPNLEVIQVKKRLFIKRVTLLSIAVLVLGTAGYVLSSRSVPLFGRLSPVLKNLNENVISPLGDVLEFVTFPEFLKIPFSLDVNTLPTRINEVFDFLGVVDSNPAFLLKNHQYKALKVVTLMSQYIDSLTRLGVDNNFDFRANAGKMILVNEAFEKICLKSRFIEEHCTKLQTERLIRTLIEFTAQQKG